MRETLTVSPAVYAAIGAALSYYGGTGPMRLGGVLLVTGISFLCVLTQGPVWFWGDPKVHRRVRRGMVYLIALYLGFGLGLGAGVSRPVRLGLPDAKVMGVYGILQDDPRDPARSRAVGNLALQSVSGPGGIRASAKGMLTVFFPDEAVPRLREFGRGSEVYIEGTLFSFKESRDNARGNLRGFRAQSVHIVQPASALEQIRTGVRLYLMKRFAGPVWGGLASALLAGIRDTLNTELSESYRYAGCSHVLALSGMHLTIVAGVIARILKKPLGLMPAGIIGTVCILVYVYLVGNLPSLTRAAIMYIAGTLGVLGRLPKQPASLLGMTFLIQLGLQPESGHSISFMLSYSALGGILFIGEAIHDLIRGRVPEFLARPLAASLGAFIATAAVIAMFFGMLRPVGILAGLVVVPLTALFMTAALILLALDAVAPFLVAPCEMILFGLYAILERLTSLCALVPGISFSGPAPAVYLSLGLLPVCLGLRAGQRLLRRDIAPFD